jgi:hypothetical protein
MCLRPRKMSEFLKKIVQIVALCNSAKAMVISRRWQGWRYTVTLSFSSYFSCSEQFIITYKWYAQVF